MGIAYGAEKSNFGGWVYQPLHESFLLSQDAAAILGVDWDELPHSLNEILSRIVEGDRGRLRTALETFASTGASLSAMATCISAECEATVLEFQGTSFKPSTGEIIHQGVVLDVSSLYRVESESNQLSTAVEHISDQVILTDKAGKITYVNKSFEESTGYTKEESCGQAMSLVQSGVQSPAFYKQLWRVILSGKPWQGNLVNKDKHGRLYIVEATISPVCTTTGEVCSFVSVQRDATRRLSLEKTHRQGKKMEALGTLAGGIAHDFNNILQSILGFTSLVEAEVGEDEVITSYLDEIKKGGEHAVDLIAQILTFSRLRATTEEQVNLSELIREVEYALRADVPPNIKVSVTESMPHSVVPYIHGSKSGIHQILINLACNSIYAMKESGGVLDISLTQVPHLPVGVTGFDGPATLITVRDTGCGISQLVLDRVTDPYFTTKPPNEGSGLGLAAVQGLVNEMGIAFSISSTEGQGTVVYLYFPSVQEEELQRDTLPHTLNLEGTETVLVVDDDDKILEQMLIALESKGYRSLTAQNACEGQELLWAHEGVIDMIIVDEVMPEERGLDFMKRVRVRWPNIKVIMCTGMPTEELEVRVKSLGFSLVRKPIKYNELFALMRRLFEE